MSKVFLVTTKLEMYVIAEDEEEAADIVEDTAEALLDGVPKPWEGEVSVDTLEITDPVLVEKHRKLIEDQNALQEERARSVAVEAP